MTDGPFRNTELPSRWKRYGRDLVSDAISHEERVARVCHNMLADTDVKSFKAIWDALDGYAQRPQMDFDPIPAIEAIFDNHPNSAHVGILQKHVNAHLRDAASVQEALDRGLLGAAGEWREIVKNRFDEHCLAAQDRGDMNTEDYRKGIARNRNTFNDIDLKRVCDALRAGGKSAFKSVLQKKKGIDEGPDE